MVLRATGSRGAECAAGDLALSVAVDLVGDAVDWARRGFARQAGIEERP
jgi:hypothetical protein